MPLRSIAYGNGPKGEQLGACVERGKTGRKRRALYPSGRVHLSRLSLFRSTVRSGIVSDADFASYQIEPNTVPFGVGDAGYELFR